MKHRSVVSTRRRLGGTALGLGGLAFAVIQVLQQTLGAFDPRPLVSLLIAVTIGFAGLALQRARHVSARGRAHAELLRVWPLRRLADTDPLALGVFPPPDCPDGATPGPYVARDADGALRRALELGGLIVLVGPDRAGKSRSASEVARSALGDRLVVVPLHGEALAGLIGDPSFAPLADAVWWLDDLERFVGRLGGAELATLLDGRTVLTTIRPRAWDELLRAAGDDGERGRRLAAAARVITLPAAASAAESERARELHPDLDLSAGLGEALGACATPAAQEDASEIASPAARRERDPALAFGVAATAAAALLLAVVVGEGGWAERVAPPISAQLADIRRDAERAGAATVVTRDQRLHGGEDRSHSFVLRPAAAGSDELRIYDEVDGYLRQRLRFEPRTGGVEPGGGLFNPLPSELRAGVADYRLSLSDPLDVDGDGKLELVAVFKLDTLPPVQVPILLGWDDRRRAYVLSRLLPGQRDPELDDYLRGSYVLADRRAGTRLPAGAVSAFQIVPGPQGARLVTASDIAREGFLATSVYALDLRRGRVTPAMMCSPEGLLRNPRNDASAALARVATRLARDASGGCAIDSRGRRSGIG